MNICLYSTYVPHHFGGGEKYLLDVARALISFGHTVSLAVSSEQPLSKRKKQKIRSSYEQFFDIDLSQLHIINTPLNTKQNIIKKLLWTHRFDGLFYLTDGSFFFSLARKNIVHIQFPLKLDKSSFIDRLKLKNWQTKITNSFFTKKVVEPTWPVTIDEVHQPMISVNKIGRGVDFNQKEKVILHVGRFFSHLHSKRQDILVQIFKRLLDKYPKIMTDWQLVLIGTVEDKEFASGVAQAAADLPVKILHEVGRQELLDWYRRSSIYWHATGYRVNPIKHPEKVEHFGISTVEAMAAGNAPVVIGKGGQLEILNKNLRKWSWLTQRDCIKKTRKVVKDDSLRLSLQRQAQKQAAKFGPELFTQKLKQIIS